MNADGDLEEAKCNFNKAKEICPLLSLLIASDGLASQVLENKWKYIFYFLESGFRMKVTSLNSVCYSLKTYLYHNDSDS